MLLLIVVMVVAAAMMLVLLLIVMVMATAMVLVLLLIVVMVVAAAMMLVLFLIVMVMAAAAMMVVFLLQLLKLRSDRGLTLHRFHQLRAGELMPGSGNQGSGLIMLPDQRHGSIQLFLRNGIGAGQNDGGGSFDLVIVELAKVLHIHLHLAGIGYSNGIAQNDLVIRYLFHSGDDIG